MRRRDAGVVLLSVLALLGIAAALVHLMLVPGEASIARSQRFSEAGQALALVRAGEQSAIAALLRDLRDAPEVDHPGEPWAAVAQDEVEIAGGSFALAIADARDRIDLNGLEPAAVEDLRMLLALAGAAGLEPARAASLAAALEAERPLAALDDLAGPAGLSQEELERLAALADALPADGAVNLNTAPEPVIALLLGDPARARALAFQRERAGHLGPEEVERLGIELPPSLGLRSDLFRLRLRVRVGETRQVVESLLHRREGGTGPEVAVVARSIGAPGTPPLPLP